MRVNVILLAGLGFPGGGMVQRATADDWDQRTVFTFSGRVEIPGQVLPAGTYIFKLANSTSNRNIVQVFGKNEKHLYGTFLAIPDERLQPARKPIITFDETPAGSPEAVQAWFYPRENYGNQFVYPKTKAVALAKANSTPVSSMLAEFEEVEIAEVFVAADTGQPPATLPATGSPLPLIGLVGLLSPGSGPRSAIYIKGVLKCQLIKTNLQRAARPPLRHPVTSAPTPSKT
jgi:hypothetical protein